MEQLDNNHHLTTKAVYDFKLVKLAIEQNDQKAYAELMNPNSLFFINVKLFIYT